MSRRGPLGLLLAIVLAACTDAAQSSAPTAGVAATLRPASVPPVELNVLAAASLKGALEAAVTAYQTAKPSVTLILSTDSSAALATKIEQGAPADVLLSADTANPQKLVEGGFAEGPAIVFAGNELTLIVPTDNPAAISSPADLARAGLKVIAAGEEVPITKYATQLVQNLAQEAGYPAGFEAAYLANIASREENVKAVVARIELGEGDAAIVYATDASASTNVAEIAIPPGANVQASYAGVVIKASANPAAARAFLDWLVGPDGQAVLASFGILSPPAA